MRIPIAETADKVIDQIQDELENPEFETLPELIVRRETEGTKANTKPRKKKEA